MIDDIRKAAERARAGQAPILHRELAMPISPALQLDRAHLESKRVIAHDSSDPRSGAFDMLRTFVLQTMDQRGWRVVAVTSPTAGCGKTLTAANLALSIARLPERSVFLLDLDLRRPQIATTLGLKRDLGVLAVLQGRAPLPEAVTSIGVDRYRLDAMIAEQSVPNASEWMASSRMKAFLETIRRDFSSHIIIVDTAPMLAADDFLTLLPMIDCVLLVGAVGVSTISDIENCKRHLNGDNIVRVVLNKARENTRPYYG